MHRWPAWLVTVAGGTGVCLARYSLLDDEMVRTVEVALTGSSTAGSISSTLGQGSAARGEVDNARPIVKQGHQGPKRAIPGQKAHVASRANPGQQVNPVLPGRREREALLDRKASPDHREGQKRVRLPFELFVASLQSPANRGRLSSAPIAQALRMKLNLLPSLFRREPRD